MNIRIQRLRAAFDEINGQYEDGMICEDECRMNKAWYAERTLEHLCDDGAPQGDLDYVAGMLSKALAEGAR